MISGFREMSSVILVLSLQLPVMVVRWVAIKSSLTSLDFRRSESLEGFRMRAVQLYSAFRARTRKARTLPPVAPMSAMLGLVSFEDILNG